VSREAHAPFCESLEVRFLWATHLVVILAHKDDAERVLRVLEKRLGKYGLELHPDKTRMIDFRFQPQSGHDDSQKSWATTFNFLGHVLPAHMLC
jgi:RNA-directed DNA polymerase